MTLSSTLLARLQPQFGTEIAVSDWLTIDQARIDAFAAATGDQQ
jgi:acyl dehydratase